MNNYHKSLSMNFDIHNSNKLENTTKDSSKNSIKRTKSNNKLEWDVRHHVVDSKDKFSDKNIDKKRPLTTSYKSTHGNIVKSVIDTGKDPHTAPIIKHRPNTAFSIENEVSALPWNNLSKESKRQSLHVEKSKQTVQFNTVNNLTKQLHRINSKAGMSSLKSFKLTSKQSFKAVNADKKVPQIQETKKEAYENKNDFFRNNKTKEICIPSEYFLDLQEISNSESEEKKSCIISPSGSMEIPGFKIEHTGISRSNTDKTLEKNTSSDIWKDLIMLSVLGKGAGGTVYKAAYLPTMQLVAVKIIPIFETDKRQQMISELQTLYTNLVPLTSTSAKYTLCPYIVSFYDAFINSNDATISIVVEYMDGGSLQDIIDTGGCNNEDALSKISYRILQALAFLHNRHQMHRDIKPSNLLINHKGHVKVSDFGISKNLDDSMDCAKTFVGTLIYMSPERITGDEYSYDSDIWSLGLSILTCYLGKFPYSCNGYWDMLRSVQSKEVPTLFSEDISNDFKNFLLKCLEKDRNRRPSAKELLCHPFIKPASEDELEQLLDFSIDKIEESSHISSDEEMSIALSELDIILEKLICAYRKELRTLISNKTVASYSSSLSWIRTLPLVQKSKLDFLASQIGIQKSVVNKKVVKLVRCFAAEIKESYFADNDTS